MDAPLFWLGKSNLLRFHMSSLVSGENLELVLNFFLLSARFHLINLLFYFSKSFFSFISVWHDMYFFTATLYKGTFSLSSWEDVVDDHFSLKIQQRCLRVAPADESAVKVLQAVSGAWSLEHDEALVQLMAQHIPRDNDALGAIKSFVELVDVSSYCVSDTRLLL